MLAEKVITVFQTQTVTKGKIGLSNTRALTKIQSIILIVVIVVPLIGGSLAYILLREDKLSNTIKIGVFTDLDTENGRTQWQGAMLAAEQLNDEGGILGKQIEVIGEDNDAMSNPDPALLNLALTRLLSYHEVDFIIGLAANQGFMVQDIVAEHETIFLEFGSNEDEYTERVLEDYDKCKYFFRVTFNATSAFLGATDSLVHLREITGFNKVGYIGEDLGWATGIMDGLDAVLPELYGFDVVYRSECPFDTIDFTSYFVAAEAAGVEILVPFIGGFNGIPFVKEYNDRQSPMVIFGGFLNSVAAGPKGWNNTDGKCEYVSNVLVPAEAGYPLTTKTLPARNAYIDRWGEIPDWGSAVAYDLMRYILPDAIERAGTLDVDAVIQALETTSIETTSAKDFVFTSSHDLMMADPNNPDDDHSMVLLFQWVDEKQVPVYPKKIMDQAGVTYTNPDWSGPWD